MNIAMCEPSTENSADLYYIGADGKLLTERFEAIKLAANEC